MPAHRDAHATVWRIPATVVLVITALLAIGLCAYGFCRACASIDDARRARAAGIGLIMVVVFLWTGSSVVIQLVFEEAHFRKPFFLTWYGFALQTVYLPFYPQELGQLVLALRDECTLRGRTRRGAYDLVGVARPPRVASRQDSADDVPPATEKAPTAALGSALRLGILFFSYQLFFNVGLELTAVSTATVIAASSGLWTLLFSAWRLGERVGPVKLFSTVLTFCGVLLVVLASGPEADTHPPLQGHHGHHGSAYGGANGVAHDHDDADAPPHSWGNAATLLSALVYGCYAAQLKHEVPDEQALPMPYLFGLIGLLLTICLLPCIPILHVLHIERFALPSRATLITLTLNGLLGSVLSNMLLARAMILASPLVATVGLSLSIPLAIAADALRGRAHFADAAPLLGTAAVWCGFLGVSAAEPIESSCVRKKCCCAAGYNL